MLIDSIMEIHIIDSQRMMPFVFKDRKIGITFIHKDTCGLQSLE